MMIVSYEYYIGIEEGECSPSKVHSCYFLTHFPALLERPSFPFQEQANIWQPKGPSHALVVTVDASGHSNRSANTWWCPPKCLDKKQRVQWQKPDCIYCVIYRWWNSESRFSNSRCKTMTRPPKSDRSGRGSTSVKFTLYSADGNGTLACTIAEVNSSGDGKLHEISFPTQLCHG